MDRLSIVLILATAVPLAGALVILFLTLGWYGWAPIVAAAVIGFGLAWPVARLISKRIKRRDPEWQARKGAEKRRAEHEAGPPEV